MRGATGLGIYVFLGAEILERGDHASDHQRPKNKAPSAPGLILLVLIFIHPTYASPFTVPVEVNWAWGKTRTSVHWYRSRASWIPCSRYRLNQCSRHESLNSP